MCMRACALRVRERARGCACEGGWVDGVGSKTPPDRETYASGEIVSVISPSSLPIFNPCTQTNPLACSAHYPQKVPLKTK